MALKHVGRIKNNRAKVVVAYRTIPNDAYSCLVVPTAELASDEHDTLIKAVESAAGQEAGELYEVMQRTTLPDGRNMLKGFHQRGNLRKFPTSEIEMTPNTNTAILLSDLNGVIAEQKGIAVADLAISTTEAAAQYEAPAEETVNETPAAPASDVITDDVLAAQYRSQADALFKEAKKLREQAEELSPTKRTSKKKAESVEA
tara:strand:+ start:85 stop:690 length:606 start_codon:yes stop_codon:yes gene_type:complete